MPATLSATLSATLCLLATLCWAVPCCAPQRGDVVILDFSAARADGGEELPVTQREGMQLDTAEADRVFLPGACARSPETSFSPPPLVLPLPSMVETMERAWSC